MNSIKCLFGSFVRGFRIGLLIAPIIILVGLYESGQEKAYDSITLVSQRFSNVNGEGEDLRILTLTSTVNGREAYLVWLGSQVQRDLRYEGYVPTLSEETKLSFGSGSRSRYIQCRVLVATHEFQIQCTGRGEERIPFSDPRALDRLIGLLPRRGQAV